MHENTCTVLNENAANVHLYNTDRHGNWTAHVYSDETSIGRALMCMNERV